MTRFTASATCLLAALAFLLPSCGNHQPNDARSHRYRSEGEVKAALTSGPSQLSSISDQLRTNHRGFEQLASGSGPSWRARGYMNSRESDRMETLLFRFITAQDSLTNMAGAMGGNHPTKLFPDDASKTAAHLLATEAQLLLLFHRAEFVSEFKDDPIAITKLNEAFYRSEIPGGSYDKLHLSVTSDDSLQRLHAAQVLFEHDREQGHLKQLTANRPNYATLVAELPDEFHRTREALQPLSQNPLVRKLSHSEAAALARKTSGILGSSEYKARSLLFKDVSRIGSPTRKLLSFSPSQHSEIQSLLEPGDIVLTYTAGYASNIFIPGRFKHGITFIGSPEQRAAAGISPELLPGLATPRRAEVAEALTQTKTAKGQDADVIEAVAEGVIFNHLGYLMDTHVNRLAVLRPKLSTEDRAAFLAGVFALHGDEYDFMFDFGDASRQVCTEVIYRAIDGRGGIQFPLKKRGGHPNLSADDLVNYHFDTNGRHFEFILYADENPTRIGHRAIIYTGDDGEAKLEALMQSQ